MLPDERDRLRILLAREQGAADGGALGGDALADILHEAQGVAPILEPQDDDIGAR